MSPLTWEDVPAYLEELKEIARRLLARESNAHSLDSAALVQTALRRQRPEDKPWDEVCWENREVFFAAAYRAMQRALIDHARYRKAQKRDSSRTTSLENIQLENLVGAADDRPEQVVALCAALERLEVTHPDWAEMIRHRFFGGHSVQETAELMGKDMTTVSRWWRQARPLLYQDILADLNTEPGTQP